MANYGRYYGDEKLPRGIRNNNPGNAEWGSPWQGLVPRAVRTDPRFCQCVDAAFGIRIIAVTLTTYFDKRKAKDGSKIDSIREVIARWAPAVENNVSAYAAQISAVLNVDPESETLNLHDYDTLRGIVEGIIRHENGKGPLSTVNTWYTNEEVDEGMRRAGVVKKKSSATVPLTKTSVAGAGTAALGVAQLAEVVQPIKSAMDSAHGDISSGDWVRIVFGVATVAVGVYIGYVQYRKNRAGATV